MGTSRESGAPTAGAPQQAGMFDESQTVSTAPAPKDASTVMLVRDGDGGVEVFLLRRVAGMAFAGGMTVFPGGGVDPSDGTADVRWSGPSPAWWAERFGVDEARAKALVCAAVRETFEECGVLLAGPTEDTVVADTAGYAEARRQLESRELSFADFLTRENLVLRADLLRPWANWITPVQEGRRYDTRFFVAVLPEGQNADGETSEAAEVAWRTPTAAVDDWRQRRSVLLPPTWRQLATLGEFDGVDAILAAEPEISPILPELSFVDGKPRVSFPGDEGYYDTGALPWG
ncbi:NUDIX domain-containing protein [Rhodococcus hoagii]|uniref:NUDIX hydrolase n=1 Tax=Rhodococcus hoagii TaxID=43767 RepID=UPI000A113F39|nr:NUDIX domain-containing protein [Prescottella equi]NKS96353.1 NUDIX domain-containing protein [Prescottella equi]